MIKKYHLSCRRQISMNEIESGEKGILRAIVAFTRRGKVFRRKQRGEALPVCPSARHPSSF